MRREKHLSIIVIVLLFLSIFSTTLVSVNFDSSENIIEQVLEENSAENENDDKFLQKFSTNLFFYSEDTKTFLSHPIKTSYIERNTPFRPPIFS